MDAALRLRYQRQLHLPGWGNEAQQALARARVLLVGMGGLGCPVSLYLTAAGVGTLGLMDEDRVSLSNLQRQVLYASTDVGALKVEAAARRLKALNPDLNCEVFAEALTAFNAQERFADFDLIVDCTDNLRTRYLMNDLAQLMGKPWVYGSVYRFEGQVASFPPQPGCYRCLYPELPADDVVPSCSEAGVLGTLPGTVGQIQATEVLRQIAQWGPGLSQQVLIMDLKHMDFHKLKRPVNPDCTACGPQAVFDARHYLLPEDNVPCLTPDEVTPELHILDVRETWERASGYLEGAHIPLGDLEALSEENLLQVVNPRVPLLVYCQKGLRSAKAVTYLQNKGFSQIFSLRGGYENWVTQRTETPLA